MWTSWVIRKVQIKAPTKFPVSPLDRQTWRGLTLASVGEDVEQQELSHCGWEHYSRQPSWKTVWPWLLKLIMCTPYDLAVPVLGTYILNTLFHLLKWGETSKHVQGSFASNSKNKAQPTIAKNSKNEKEHLRRLL